MRLIVLDTETTGLEPKQGHRLIEVGALEMVNRRLTGKSFHEYVHPERDIPMEAQAVHGIVEDYLKDKPLFSAIADDFIEFVRDAELIIHNAPFDLGFLDNELLIAGKATGRSYPKISDICKITDTLKLAKQKHPGQKNNLDQLSRRYGISNANRSKRVGGSKIYGNHGAILDCEILAEVFLLMTGGQTDLMLAAETPSSKIDATVANNRIVNVQVDNLPVVLATEKELSAHQAKLQTVAKESGGKCLWSELPD